MQTNPKHYTVNTLGDNRIVAGRAGYHAYYANGVTAIEVQAKNKKEAGPFDELVMKVAAIHGTERLIFHE